MKALDATQATINPPGGRRSFRRRQSTVKSQRRHLKTVGAGYNGAAFATGSPPVNQFGIVSNCVTSGEPNRHYLLVVSPTRSRSARTRRHGSDCANWRLSVLGSQCSAPAKP